MAPSCRPPKGQGVKAHVRAAPFKRRKRKPVAQANYWTCVNHNGGGTCGVHHRNHNACAKHARRLNLAQWRAGRGRGAWETRFIRH